MVFHFSQQIRRIDVMGNYCLGHIDEFIDQLLTEDSALDVTLPRIAKRWVLEGTGTIEPRRSALEEDIDEILEEDNEEKVILKLSLLDFPLYINAVTDVSINLLTFLV